MHYVRLIKSQYDTAKNQLIPKINNVILSQVVLCITLLLARVASTTRVSVICILHSLTSPPKATLVSLGPVMIIFEFGPKSVRKGTGGCQHACFS